MFCGIVVKAEGVKNITERVSVCVDVVNEAQRQNVEPALAVAVAWRESALTRDAVSSAGAVGPMQVMPRFWCKSKSCNYIEAGVRALKYYTKRYGEQGGLCAYLSGRPCQYGGETVSAYRSSVIMKAASYAELWRKVCDSDGC
tara:strand:+ start:2109 stop:2537 length:429 start_codon:yes stop_codon:yes gene_type:complete